MPLAGFESVVSAGERPQTHALDRAATGTGILTIYITIFLEIYVGDLCMMRAGTFLLILSKNLIKCFVSEIKKNHI